MDETKLKQFLLHHPDTYPPCRVYLVCLNYAQQKFNISQEKCCRHYGLYDGKQWYQLLFGDYKSDNTCH